MALLQQPWSWALLLVLLPILIHWLQFRRTRTLLFPGVHRLKQLTQSGQNPERLKHRLLLLLRSLALLALVLGFLWAMQGRGLSESSSYHIVISQSGSMRESGLNEQAKVELDQWLSKAPNEDRFCLPQLSSQLLSAEQLRRRLNSGLQDWPHWTSGQVVRYARSLNDPEAQCVYLCDAYSQAPDSSVLNIVLPSDQKGPNAFVDTAYRVYSAKGPAYKVRIGAEGFAQTEDLPALSICDAEGTPLQRLEYKERGNDWAEALFEGAIPISGAQFRLSASGWEFDDRLYVAPSVHIKQRLLIRGSHPFPIRWVSSQTQFGRVDSAFEIAYLSEAQWDENDQLQLNQAMNQGATVVCLDVSSAARLLDVDIDMEPADSDPQLMSQSGLKHSLFDGVFQEVGDAFNRRLPSFTMSQVPSAESLSSWEVLLVTESGLPLMLMRQEGMGRVYLWLGGAQESFVSSAWAVAILGMPAMQLAWANGPLYGVLGLAHSLELGPIRPGHDSKEPWHLVQASDSFVPEVRKRAGNWELPLGQSQLKSGLHVLRAPGLQSIVALNEPRLTVSSKQTEGSLTGLPSWKKLKDQSSQSQHWEAILFGLALLFLSIESVFVFLKERNEQQP